MSSTTRCTFSLPAELASDLRYVSRRFGCSQSALVASLLADTVSFMRHTIGQVPESPTPEDEPRLRRLRGESIEHIKGVLGDFQAELDNHLSGESSHETH